MKATEWKKYPSRARAKGIREFERREPFRAPKIDTMAAMLIRDALLVQQIRSEEAIEGTEPALRELEGMDADLLGKLTQHGIRKLDDLADLAVDELVEISGIDDERARTLITRARAHWFEAEQ